MSVKEFYGALAADQTRVIPLSQLLSDVETRIAEVEPLCSSFRYNDLCAAMEAPAFLLLELLSDCQAIIILQSCDSKFCEASLQTLFKVRLN